MGCCASSNVTKTNKISQSRLSMLVNENKKQYKAKIEKPNFSDESGSEEGNNYQFEDAKLMIRTKTTVSKKKLQIARMEALEEIRKEEAYDFERDHGPTELNTDRAEELQIKKRESKMLQKNRDLDKNSDVAPKNNFFSQESEQGELPLDDIDMEQHFEQMEERLLRKASLGSLSGALNSISSNSVISKNKRITTSSRVNDEELYTLEKEDFFDDIGYSDEEDLRRASLELGKSLGDDSFRSSQDCPNSLDTSEDIIYKKAFELDQNKRITNDGTIIVKRKKNANKLNEALETENTKAFGYSKKGRNKKIKNKEREVHDSGEMHSFGSGFVSIQQSVRSINCFAEKSIKMPSLKRIVVDEMREDASIMYDITRGNGSFREMSVGF